MHEPSGAPMPPRGWWRGKSAADVEAELKRYRQETFDVANVQFTHDVILPRFRVALWNGGEPQFSYAGTPFICFGGDCPVEGGETVEGSIIIGEAAIVDDYAPAFRFGLIRIGNGRPIYGRVPRSLTLRAKG